MTNTLQSGSEDIHEAPSHTRFDVSVEELLQVARKGLHDFDDKNIADIGGGAGLLDLYIQNNASPKKITIVDPAFQKWTYDEVAERAKWEFEDRLTEPILLTENKRQLHINYQTSQNLHDTMLMDDTQNPGKYLGEMAFLAQKNDALEQENQRMEANKKKYKENAEIFDRYLKGEYAGVEINSSPGEKIVGIKGNSQDIVFINHVLHKFPDTYYAILKEADRILTSSGEIIIIEYDHRKDVHDDFFRKLCDKAGVIAKEQDQSIGIILKKGEYVKLKPLPLAIP